LCLGFAFTQRILPLCFSLWKPALHRSGFFACLTAGADLLGAGVGL
jgi:hypothetical protein